MQTVDPDRTPVEPTTGQPLAPMAQPGYYSGYSTLGQQRFWDEATRNVVRKRVQEIPPLRFFTPQEARLMKAVLDRVLPQDDRDEDHKIPILNYVDDKLSHNRISGYQYEDMPPYQKAHRLGLRAIEAIATHLYQKPFLELRAREQEEVLKTIHDGNPPAATEIWQIMSVHHYWSQLMHDAVEAYYAHPYAWDEMGFGGPAYPRPYFRLERGEPEPWEVEEQRYAWGPPPTSISGEYTTIELSHPHRAAHTTGAGGTH